MVFLIRAFPFAGKHTVKMQYFLQFCSTAGVTCLPACSLDAEALGWHQLFCCWCVQFLLLISYAVPFLPLNVHPSYMCFITSFSLLFAPCGSGSDSPRSQSSGDGTPTTDEALPQPGQVYSVTVVAACGCCLLWAVRADSDSDEKRKKIKTRLTEYSANADASQRLTDFNVGRMCAACGQDGTWRRGRISSPPFAVGESRWSVSVQFVDDGVSEVLASEGLLQLPDDMLLSAFPAQAIKLWLHGLYPSTEGQHNSEMAMSVLNSMTQGQKCEAEVCHASREGVIYVRLTKDGQSINDALLTTPFVEPYQGRGGSANGKRGNESFPSRPNSGASNKRPSTPVTTGLNRGPPQAVMPGYSAVRMQGPNRPSATNFHKGIGTDPSGYTVMQLTGSPTDVRLCSITEFAHFSVQIVRPDLQQGLQRLNSDMDALHARTKNASYTPREGDICCARFRADRRFYRARVEHVHADGRVDVTFVDYGNRDIVPVSDLRHMKREFGSLPFQAISCALAGIVPGNPAGVWPPPARDMLQRPGRLVARLVMPPSSPKNPCLVELYDRTPGFNVLLNDELVLRGHALPADVAAPSPILSAPATPVSPTAPIPANFPISITSGNSTARTLRDDRAVQLTAGKVYSVEVVYIHHVGMFYLRLADESLRQQLVELNNHIHEVCSSPSSYDASFHPSVGELCCARFSDNGRYYRAKVHHLCLGDTKVVVYYVDLGQREVVSYTEVRPMTSSMVQLPFQAIPASFYNLTKGTGQWPEEGKRLLHQLTKSKSLRCVCHGGQMTYRVELFDDADQENPLDIRAALQLAGVGRIITTAADAKAAAAAAAAAAAGDKMEVNRVQLSSLTLSRPASTQRFMVESMKRAVLPTDGTRVNVVVTDITSPALFWVTCVDNVGALNNLLQSMATSYPADAEPHRPLAGEVCAARFSGDGAWYRALVTSVADTFIQVTFVDFGNSETTTINALQPLRPEHSVLALQGIRCCLAGVKPLHGAEWDADATGQFRQLTEGVRLTCNSTSQRSGHRFSIHLALASSPNEIIANRLVCSGYAAGDSS